ncbi:MAG: bile acid:sodium symporter family protein [Bacteroidetes bacterium]|nr:bile acid:sodium symporter family protein [Bacteroidota bacterium]
MNRLNKIFLICSGVAATVLLIGIVLQQEDMYKPFAIATAICAAIGLGAVPSLKGYQYTAWIIAAVVAGMLYPAAFSKWGSFELRNKTTILLIIQIVMFGMGIQMSIKDFSGIAQTGKGVAIGLLCHFSVMPLMGLLLTKIFHFEPEIAAGIILIGSCSSGLASNVMVYLARANLVLSVIVTAMATMLAPFFTPLLMKLLAGTLIKIDFLNMMLEIIKMVIVPIFAALLHDYLKHAAVKQTRTVYSFFAAAILWLGIVIYLISGQTEGTPGTISITLSGFFAGAIIVGVLYHRLQKIFPKLDAVMPYCSMFGIIYFTTVTTAAGHDNLMKVGFLLFIASVIHNGAGYFFGYWLSRLFKLDKNSARTVAFEVGLQNGGMASGLAGSMGKLGTVGLPAAVFSPWMNISGSILANYWRKRPPQSPKGRSLEQ